MRLIRMKIDPDSHLPFDSDCSKAEDARVWERVWAETRSRSKPNPKVQTAEMEKRVFSSIQNREGTGRVNVTGRTASFRKYINRSGMWTATAVAALIAVLTVVVGIRSTHNAGGITKMHLASEVGTAAPRSFQLPDGSQVVISPGTRVDYEKNSSGARTVTVSGEALFTVIHKTNNPLQVNVGSSVVRVLGTTFSVRKFASDSQTTVAVLDGKVAMDNAVLSKGEVRDVYASGRVEHRTNQDIASMNAWADGRMQFVAAPLSSVMQEIGRWYGAKFIVTDPDVSAIRLTLTIRRESLETVLSSIEKMADVSVAYKGDSITISSKQFND